MNIGDLVERFIVYAVNHKDIQHDPDPDAPVKSFVQCDIEDIQVSINTGIKFPCVFLQTPEVEKGGQHDGVTEDFEGSWVILMECPKGTPAKDKMATITRCKTISDSFYKRMVSEADDHFKGAQVKTAEGVFGPLAIGVIGWGVNFGFEQGFDAQNDPNDWEDID